MPARIMVLLVAGIFPLIGTGCSGAGAGSHASTHESEGSPETRANESAPKDLEFTVGPQRIAGIYRAPSALAPRTFPVAWMTSRSVEEQRSRYRNATGSRKTRHGEALAVLLFARVEDRTEARTVLQALTANGKAPESTHAKLAVAEYLLGDLAACAAQYDVLIDRFAKSPDQTMYRARRAWLALLEGNNAKAAGTIDVAGARGEKAPAAAAYIDAWLQIRRGQPAAAFASISRAAKRWPDGSNLDDLRSELMWMGVAAGVGPKEIASVLRATIRHDRAEMGDLLGELASAYAAAGLFQRASACGDMRAAGARSEILVETRVAQARAALALGKPGRGAKLYASAWEAAVQAGRDLSDERRETLANEVLAQARASGDAYAVTGNQAHRAAAAKLYAVYAGIPARADRTPVKSEAEKLAALNPTAGQTEHTQAQVDRMFAAQRLRIRACFERALQTDAQLYGDVTLGLAFTGNAPPIVESDPPSGTEGIGSVAACAAEQAHDWRLPGRTGQGTTRVRVLLELRPAPAEVGVVEEGEREPAARHLETNPIGPVVARSAP